MHTLCFYFLYLYNLSPAPSDATTLRIRAEDCLIMHVKWGRKSFIRFFLRPSSATASECPLRMPPFYMQWPTPFSINYFLPLSTVVSNAVVHLCADHVKVFNAATISLYARSTHTNSGLRSLPTSTSPYKHTGWLWNELTILFSVAVHI